MSIFYPVEQEKENEYAFLIVSGNVAKNCDNEELI